MAQWIQQLLYDPDDLSPFPKLQLKSGLLPPCWFNRDCRAPGNQEQELQRSVCGSLSSTGI